MTAFIFSTLQNNFTDVLVKLSICEILSKLNDWIPSDLQSTINMSHRKFWVLGIVSIFLLSTVSQAHAEPDDDNTEVRAGKVSIIRDADGNTQIDTGRVKVDSGSPRVRSNRYRHSTRYHRTTRCSVIGRAADACIDRENTIKRINTSSRSGSTQVNSQVTKIRGNNRTVIQSSTSR